MLNTKSFVGTYRPKTSFAWLTWLDSFGLVAALLVIEPRLLNAESGTFLLILLGFTLVSWFAVSHTRNSGPRQLFPKQLGRLVVPWLAVLGTLSASALLRDYYSGAALLLFASVWTIWMLVARIALPLTMQRTRVLLVGTSPFHEELERLPQLSVTKLSTAPDTFDRWDLIVVDPKRDFDEDWLGWLAHADLAGKTILNAPLLLEIITGRVSTQVLNGRWAPIILHGSSAYAFWKRGFDLLFTLAALPFLLPLSLLVAVAVFLDGGRPVLFWQERVGKKGLPFQMVKFRSMRRDSESGGAKFATQNDLRVTRIGAFLRKFRLDELPQFWNVLRGDMSIIGPRPEQRVFVEQFSSEVPLYDIRHHVRPGITGWAQVKQGYAAGADEAREKLRCDFYYIKHFSVGLDLRIVGGTIRTILSGFGAR